MLDGVLNTLLVPPKYAAKYRDKVELVAWCKLITAVLSFETRKTERSPSNSCLTCFFSLINILGIADDIKIPNDINVKSTWWLHNLINLGNIQVTLTFNRELLVIKREKKLQKNSYWKKTSMEVWKFFPRIWGSLK